MLTFLYPVFEGGPWTIAMFCGMCVSFGFALYLAWKRRVGAVGVFCAMAPVMLGGWIMWRGICGLSYSMKGIMCEVDPLVTLHEIQGPFLLGASLSAVALLVQCIAWWIKRGGVVPIRRL